MKKIVIVLVCVLLVTVPCVPAFAGGSPTVVKPVNGAIDLWHASGDFIINEDCTVDINVDKNVTLTIAPNVTVTLSNHFANLGTLNVLGNLIVTKCDMGNPGTINVGCVGTIEGTIPGTVNKGVHHYVNGVCENCNAQCPHANTEIETVTTITKTCKDCEKVLDEQTTTTSTLTSSASTLSEGNLAIITAVAGVAFGFLAAMVIFKKKKPALASGENTDEE